MYKFCFLQSKMILVISIFRYFKRRENKLQRLRRDNSAKTPFLLFAAFKIYASMKVAQWDAVQGSDTTMMP